MCNEGPVISSAVLHCLRVSHHNSIVRQRTRTEHETQSVMSLASPHFKLFERVVDALLDIRI